MTPAQRKAAIEAHRLEHERKHARKRAARIAATDRKKRRGLEAVIERLKT